VAKSSTTLLQHSNSFPAFGSVSQYAKSMQREKSQVQDLIGWSEDTALQRANSNLVGLAGCALRVFLFGRLPELVGENERRDFVLLEVGSMNVKVDRRVARV
jgi:hypothetical protein